MHIYNIVIYINTDMLYLCIVYIKHIFMYSIYNACIYYSRPVFIHQTHIQTVRILTLTCYICIIYTIYTYILTCYICMIYLTIYYQKHIQVVRILSILCFDSIESKRHPFDLQLWTSLNTGCQNSPYVAFWFCRFILWLILCIL